LHTFSLLQLLQNKDLKIANCFQLLGGMLVAADTQIGPSGVRALPWLLAETKVATILGIFPLSSTEGVAVRFRNIAWAPN
jgi:hypothetical protein